MLSGTPLLLVFFGAIALLLLLIIRFRLNPFLALLLISLLTGFAVGMPEKEIRDAIATGFGNTLRGIGIVIGLGIILGKLFAESGATEQIAQSLIRVAGTRKIPLAIALTGYLVSIPVFMDAAFVILVSVIRKLPGLTNIPLIAYVTALSVGLITTHAMLIPTPGPVGVAETFRISAGPFVLYSLMVSLPALLAGGWLYGLLLAKSAKPVPPVVRDEPQEGTTTCLPPRATCFTILLMPIALILLGSTLTLVLPAGHPLLPLFAFIGDKNVALLISVLLALGLLTRYIGKPANQLIAEAADSAGLILLITGVGGAFGSVISSSGIGAYIVEGLTAWNLSYLFTGFLLSALLRGALGSSTVALITSASIIAPLIPSGSPAAVFTAISICAGGMCLSLPNDSGFWVVSRFSGISVTDTLKSWTMGGTIGGVIAFILTLILYQFTA
jgi:gluconate:H+ symporter, GntP family